MFFPLGLIGGLILLVLGGVQYRRETKRIKEEKGLIKCPYCAELVKVEAVVCKHCGKDLN